MLKLYGNPGRRARWESLTRRGNRPDGALERVASQFTPEGATCLQALFRGT